MRLPPQAAVPAPHSALVGREKEITGIRALLARPGVRLITVLGPDAERGTVARGDLDEDTYFYTGKVGNNPGDYMPFAITKEILDRGRERYNIYCAPCHSLLGDGNGFVPSRGFARNRASS